MFYMTSNIKHGRDIEATVIFEVNLKPYWLCAAFYSSALMVLMSSFAAQFSTSSRFSAVAIKLGN